ncbi:lysM and putative peptidoglycan-binding domain-containing protein 3 [Danio rerio]|uniref:LysM and putative peptidoglycan-binding domain-containing protein 3 n=1 Tax=Danio rerio TaxID=7955 RepID=LYSM3_DANRE|nr:lysM and putative peptidoglycan-binding domain-containing protein 3 [Danio rerio]Q6IQA2.1 RecName: Full=LysM and putative peptidoglycan-binding domain-containing protein 3 [Danio rerio]AAH71508.1 LysM, putative peptidoglycan-binding, domain containing 3 [Danio rerio]|eukprot:NP_001002104.1 lysM and putative peptidoglycan-binding domain-containing protein 3 [Danio rerio]
MTGRNQHNGFQFATAVQPATGAYMSAFGNNSETEYSEEDGEAFELRSRGRERHHRSTSRDRKDDIVYLIREIKEGDTLISISLQYFCTVADIKRANNLLTEQDFFALRSLRIPVRKFSSFTETHNTAPHKSSSPSGTCRITETPVSGASLDSTSSSSSADSVECFLQEKDKDIQQLVKSSAPSRNSLSEVVSSLEQPLLGDAERRPAIKKDPYYGADWGMRWWTAVAIMLVVGIVTPVFYLLYYEVLMKADVSHHTTIDSIRPGPTQPAIAEPLVLPQANAAPHQDSHLLPVIEQQHHVKHQEET